MGSMARNNTQSDHSLEGVHVRLLSCCMRYVETRGVAFFLTCPCRRSSAQEVDGISKTVFAPCAVPSHAPKLIKQIAVMGMIVFVQHNKTFSHVFLDDGTNVGASDEQVQVRCSVEDSETTSISVRHDCGANSDAGLLNVLNTSRHDLKVGMVVQILGRVRRKRSLLIPDHWVLQVLASHVEVIPESGNAESRMRFEYIQLWEEYYMSGVTWLHGMSDDFWSNLIHSVSKSIKATEVGRLQGLYGPELVRSMQLDKFVLLTKTELMRGTLSYLETKYAICAREDLYKTLLDEKIDLYLSTGK